MSIITRTNCRITFLEETTIEEVSNIVALVDAAYEMISRSLEAESKFDIIVCKGSWDMEVQVISREKFVKPYKGGESLVGLTDYELKGIIICDKAKFAHYLHESVHSVVSQSHSHQLREALAWYFTLMPLKPHYYLKEAPYPSWVDSIYVSRVRKLAEIVGDEFLKDLA
jgi:hypothetical protein